MTRKGLWIAQIILSILGLAFAVYLTQHFYDLHGGTAGFKSLCKVSGAMDCNAVAMSRWSELIPGLPLSSFSAGWYITIAILSVMGLRDAFWRREAARGVFVMSLIGVVFSIAYLIIMMSVIHTFCLFCLMIDGVNVLLLACAIGLPDRSDPAKDRAKWKTMATITASCVVATVLLLHVMLSPPKIAQLDEQEVVKTILATPPVSVDASAALPSIGPKDAPITIVEFSDFQCPYCKMGAMILNAVQSRFPGKVRLVFRNYPLDPTCNHYMQNAGHKYACEAARAGACAWRAGKFERVYEEFFEFQDDFATTSPSAMAERVGLAKSELDSCATSAETNDRIQRDIEEGYRFGVQATPTFFINGHKVEGPFPVGVWTTVIERLLAAGATSSSATAPAVAAPFSAPAPAPSAAASR